MADNYGSVAGEQQTDNSDGLATDYTSRIEVMSADAFDALMGLNAQKFAELMEIETPETV